MHAALLGLLLAAAPAAETAWVTADVLRVRSQPEKGDVVGRLRINAASTVRERNGGWARVEAGPVRGWVLARHLAPKQVTLAQSVREAKRTKGALRIEWLERVVALDGGDRDAWEALAQGYRAAGLGSREAYAREVLDGAAPVHFAACGEVQVSFTPALGFARVEGEAPMPGEGAGDTPETEAARRGMEALAARLEGGSWWPANGAEAGQQAPAALGVTGTDSVCTGTRRFTLHTGGRRCDFRKPSPDALLASTPILPLALEEASTDAERRARAALAGERIEVTEAEVSLVPGSPKVWEIRFEGIEAGAKRPEPVVGWAIVDAAGKVRERRVLDAGPGAERSLAGPATWGRLWHSGLRVAIVPFQWKGKMAAAGEMLPAASAGYAVFVVDADGEVHKADVVTFVEAPDPC